MLRISERPSATRPVPPVTLPGAAPSQLAASAALNALAGLGPVLSLFQAGRSRWARWTGRPARPPDLHELLTGPGLCYSVALDSHGLEEALWWGDADGRPLFGLMLLPDSDYLGWERLLDALQPCTHAAQHGIGTRRGCWGACVLRFDACGRARAVGAHGAASDGLSPLGAARAHELACRHRAERVD